MLQHRQAFIENLATCLGDQEVVGRNIAAVEVLVGFAGTVLQALIRLKDISDGKEEQ